MVLAAPGFAFTGTKGGVADALIEVTEDARARSSWRVRSPTVSLVSFWVSLLAAPNVGVALAAAGFGVGFRRWFWGRAWLADGVGVGHGRGLGAARVAPPCSRGALASLRRLRAAGVPAAN